MTDELDREGTSCAGACVTAHRGGTARRPYGLIVSRSPIFLVPSRLSALRCVPALLSLYLSLCLSLSVSVSFSLSLSISFSLSLFLSLLLSRSLSGWRLLSYNDFSWNMQPASPTSCLRPSFNSGVLIATPPTAHSETIYIRTFHLGKFCKNEQVDDDFHTSQPHTNESLLIA